MPSAFTPQQLSFTIGQIGLNLCLSFALAYLAAGVYRKVRVGPGDFYSLYITLLVTPVVVSMIMMAIGSNIALSLGLVGALSIIRFRTVIKETRDMSFLFLTIGIGLCCGSGAYPLALFGTLFVCLVLVALHYTARVHFTSSEYILVFRQRKPDHAQADTMLDNWVPWRKLHGAADLGDEQGCEYTYRIRLGKDITPEALINRLKNTEGLSQSSLISPEGQTAI